MYVESLALENYRNYAHLSVNLSPGINIFFGDNAQGKTNVLEALYMCATTKSHRGSRDREIIRFGEEEAHIRMLLSKEHVRHKIDVHLKKNKSKGIAIDGIPIRKSGELFGLVHMICFSPEDLAMIKNGPGERRRFLDLELCQLDKVYLHNISNYNKIVNQRNNLLKQIGFDSALKDTLDIWDMQMVNYGRKVIETRKLFIAQLNEWLEQIRSEIPELPQSRYNRYMEEIGLQPKEARILADSFDSTLIQGDNILLHGGASLRQISNSHCSLFCRICQRKPARNAGETRPHICNVSLI